MYECRRVLDTNQPGTYPGTKHAASRFQVLFLYNKNLARSGVSLTPDPHIGNKSHFSGLVAEETGHKAPGDERTRESAQV